MTEAKNVFLALAALKAACERGKAPSGGVDMDELVVKVEQQYARLERERDGTEMRLRAHVHALEGALHQVPLITTKETVKET